MNAQPQPDAYTPPELPSGHFAPESSPVACRVGHARAIPAIQALQQPDDRTAQHSATNQPECERNRGQSKSDSGNINGAHSAIESIPEGKTETKQENPVYNGNNDDGVRTAVSERYEGRHRITQSVCEHFESCVREWVWEHYLCGTTCALMTFLLVSMVV